MRTFHGVLPASPTTPTTKVILLYVVALLLVLLALFVINRLMRCRSVAPGALREDEVACRALGLNPTIVKLSAFTIGASFAGFAGSFFAARQGLVTPESFTFIESAMIPRSSCSAAWFAARRDTRRGGDGAAPGNARVQRIPHADLRPDHDRDDDLASPGTAADATPHLELKP
ncbi:ABC transporter permease subunit [Pseudomonas aeruginosa]